MSKDAAPCPVCLKADIVDYSPHTHDCTKCESAIRPDMTACASCGEPVSAGEMLPGTRWYAAQMEDADASGSWDFDRAEHEQDDPDAVAREERRNERWNDSRDADADTEAPEDRAYGIALAIARDVIEADESDDDDAIHDAVFATTLGVCDEDETLSAIKARRISEIADEAISDYRRNNPDTVR